MEALRQSPHGTGSRVVELVMTAFLGALWFAALDPGPTGAQAPTENPVVRSIRARLLEGRYQEDRESMDFLLELGLIQVVTDEVLSVRNPSLPERRELVRLMNGRVLEIADERIRELARDALSGGVVDVVHGELAEFLAGLEPSPEPAPPPPGSGELPVLEVAHLGPSIQITVSTTHPDPIIRNVVPPSGNITLPHVFTIVENLGSTGSVSPTLIMTEARLDQIFTGISRRRFRVYSGEAPAERPVFFESFWTEDRAPHGVFLVEVVPR